MFQIRKIVLLAQVAWLAAFVVGHGQCLGYHDLPTQEQLPVANVDVVMQDREGFLWYGTDGGGLCCDDGYQVTVFGSSGLGADVMKSDKVTCIAQDSVGRIWFGTHSGLYVADRERRSVRPVESEYIGEKKVNCIATSPDGAVWVGIRTGVVKFSADGTCLKRIGISDNRREEPWEMSLDTHGLLWVTILRGGLCSIDVANDSLTHRPWNYAARPNYVVEDTLRHCYWVGTWGGGVVRYPDMTVESATLQTVDKHKFGCEVRNLVIDQQAQLMWVSTMDDIYAYRMAPVADSGVPCLSPFPLAVVVPSGKKLIEKLCADRRGNIWVPGHSPHTFALSGGRSSGRIRRDAVSAMTQQTAYKLMVGRIACEGDYFWIYQDRTRLSLYNSATGQLAFMANDASPEPLSTQKPLARCRMTDGVWTCNGRHLIRARHDGMRICWEEVADADVPHYISALSDEGDGRLLIGTEREVMLYDYVNRTTRKLADADAVVQQVSFAADGSLSFSTDAQSPQTLTDALGHIWTRNELTLTEFSPVTGATRILRPTDRNIGMDSFTDITLAGDSICLGGIGAFCIIGSCHELDVPLPDDKIIVTQYDTLRAVHLTTLNPLHASEVRFAYRFSPSADWTELPPGQNVVDVSGIGHGKTTLWVRATDEYGVWHAPQAVCEMVRPWPMSIVLLSLAAVALVVVIVWRWRRSLAAKRCLAMSADAPVDPFLAQVESIVLRNLANVDYGVDDLSRDLSMSRMNMYRKFQSVTDVTPSEFIRLYRLRRALELLRTTNKSVSEIAYEVGFSSPQYLAKCFRKEYGITPKEARRE